MFSGLVQNDKKENIIVGSLVIEAGVLYRRTGGMDASLGALEKKSAEELSMLRLAQQDEVLKMTSGLRDMEIQAAETSLEGLNRRKNTVRNRLDYYENLVNQGLSDLEVAQDTLLYAGHILKTTAIPFGWALIPAAIPPSIMGMSFSGPTDGLKNALQITIYTLSALGEVSLLGSNLVGKHAGYNRR